MGETMKAARIRRVGIVANSRVSDGYVDRLVAVLKKNRVEISEVRGDDQPDGARDIDLVFVLGGEVAGTEVDPPPEVETRTSTTP